jgi:hypothetical protein
MKLGRVFCVLGLAVLVAGSVAYGPTCPLGTIETDARILSGKFGMISVEACFSRVGGEDTYTYRVTHMGVGTIEVCAFTVSGIGLFTTVGQTGPMAWTGTTADDAGCASWWGWSTMSTLPGGAAVGPGESATFSITVPSETTPARVQTAIGLCGGAEESFLILGPSACPGVTEMGFDASCVCGPHGCARAAAFEGDGMRIGLLPTDPDVQTIETCEPSWVRHGFSGPGAAIGTGEFRLFIDGAPVPMDAEVMCSASSELGTPLHAVLFHVQFPAEYFAPGSYDLAGEWEILASPAGPGSSFAWSITLVVEECTTCVPDPDCEAFVGDGARIHVFGPVTQTIVECEPSWVDHGFIGPGASPETCAFRLFIDGVPIPLDVDACCLDTGAAPLQRAMSHVQFPDYRFAPGVYEVTGEWERFPTAEDPDGLLYTRSITLIVESCVEPIPLRGPPLPNLTLRVSRDSCSCDYDPQQRFFCTLSITGYVKNDGVVASPPTDVLLQTEKGTAEGQIPSLDPGQGRAVRLSVSFQAEAPGSPGIPCPLDYTLAVDPEDGIQEVAEDDNSVEGNPCCR